jgi:putative SOS response-associated peptidase YedK
MLRADPDDAAKLMKPAKDGVLQQRTLGKAINNVENTGPELLALSRR